MTKSEASVEEVRRLREVYASYDNGRGRIWDVEQPAMAAVEQERDEFMDALLRSLGGGTLRDLTILDVGCGTGFDLNRLVQEGATPSRLYGIDLLPNRTAIAHATNPTINVVGASGDAIPFRNGKFDVVLMCTVLSSVQSEAMRIRLGQEVERILRPGGAVLWYDLRWSNPWNRNIRGIRSRRLRSYFPTFALRLRSITVAPPLIRLTGAYAPRVYRILKHIPFLRSHLIGLLTKKKE